MTILQSGIAQAAAASGGYQIARSLRFNIADSTYLNRTPASATSRQIFTYSLWIKNSGLPSTIQRIFGVGVTNYFGIDIGYSAGEFNINVDLGPDATRSQNYTTATFRDPSAWYHFVIAVDTTQATTANRLKIYVNNVLYSYSSTASIPQNLSTDVNNTVVHNIGRRVDGADRYCSLYMTEINLIDGQQLTPSSFGQTDSATGVWSPIAYTGTYGTNGFYLNFSDNSGTTSTTLGKDYSGNGNNWTPNNFSVTAGTGNDSLVDTPTNYGTDTGVGGEVRGNYCTLNPLDNALTLANGNLQATGGSSWSGSRAIFAVSSGKWYWECQLTSSTDMMVGLTKQGVNIAAANGYIGNATGSYGYSASNGQKYIDGAAAAAYGATWTTADIIGLAFDADAGTLTCYKNNVSQGVLVSGLTSGPYFPAISLAASSVGYINFGQRPFAYTAPSGFKALCTQNLPTPAIGATSTTLANDYFDVSIWTGAGQTGSASITGLAFQPDFVWAKQRSGGNSHLLYDVLRGPSTSGASKALVSNATAAEGSSNDNATYGYLSAFNSDGFSYFGGSSPTYFSTNGATYVGWQWKGGGTGVTNTNGSITSTVSANPTAGISIVTYTIPSASATIETFGHGLNAPPSMVIFKVRNGVDDWTVYNVNITNPLNNWMTLNTTAAAGGGTSTFSSSSTTFGVRGTRLLSSGTSGNIVAYCFTEISGFSKFGSYTGNGSADGPFVYCGFRPRYVLIRNTNGGSWEQYDTARDPYNQASLILEPNSAGAEATAAGYVLDILSNGFKLRGTGSGINTNGNTFIYMAFAESPFNYSRAR